jgi:hypothetical protein
MSYVSLVEEATARILLSTTMTETKRPIVIGNVAGAMEDSPNAM